jgi:sensor histidine kinase regulating citrate/malate metabolism
VTRRLVASYLLLALVALIALEIPLGVLYARNERQTFDLRVERDATTLASLAEDALEVGGPYDRLGTVVRDFQSDTGARAVVVDASGTSVADSDPDRPIGRDFSTRPEIAAALRGERAVGERGSQTLGDRIVYVAVPSASGGVVHGAVRLTVPSDEVDARVRRYWLVLVGIAAVVMAAVAGVGWLLARSVSSPLADL